MLARLRKAKENGESGFTLIELLVVMIIIGILAAIAIPAFLNQKNKAKETSAKSDVTNISKEIAAVLVDGDLTVLSIAAKDATTGVQVLTTKTAADAANVTTNVKLSDGNTASVAAITAPSSSYCVTVTNSTAGTSAWSAGPNGLKKGPTC